MRMTASSLRPKNTRSARGHKNTRSAGRKALAASAAKKKIRKTGKVEQIKARAFGTLGEHAESHDYPQHVTTCGACLFWKHSFTWSHECSHLNPVSQEMVTWLGCLNGLAVCTICAAHKGVIQRNRFSNGVGSFLRKEHFSRHAASKGHKAARRAWQELLRVGSTQGETVSICNIASATAASATVASATAASATAASAKDEALSTRTPQSTMGYRAVVAAHALLETAGSFHGYDVLHDALGGDERKAMESSWHCA
jgi:hypothetical protein